jgi:hypothetical protein
MYLHAISRVLFDLAAACRLDLQSQTAFSSFAEARCADSCSNISGALRLAHH